MGRYNATITGTSPRASVSDTSVWQFAVLPSAEAYCGATPTECLPFFGIAVSSITELSPILGDGLMDQAAAVWA